MFLLYLGLAVFGGALYIFRAKQGKLTLRFALSLPIVIGTVPWLVGFIKDGYDTWTLRLYFISIAGYFLYFIMMLFFISLAREGSIDLRKMFISPKDVKDPDKVELKRAEEKKEASRDLVRRVDSTWLPRLKPDKIMKYMRVAINANPNNHRAHFLLGKAYIDIGDTSSAIE